MLPAARTILKKPLWKLTCLGLCTSLIATCASPNGSGSNTGPENSIEIKSTPLTDCAQEVAQLKVMGSRNTQFSSEIVSPGAFKHQYKVITIDTTAIDTGTLYISGKLGNGSQGSFALMDASPAYPCSGESSAAYGEATNQEPGSTFEIKHTFVKGQVYRLLSEGSWHDPEGTKNTVAWTIRVAP
jgi:hypothetical protein